VTATGTTTGCSGCGPTAASNTTTSVTCFAGRRAEGLQPRRSTSRRRHQGLARLPAHLLRPPLPCLEPIAQRLRPAALCRELARTAQARVVDPAEGARDREPLLCGRGQSRRPGWQRRRLLRRQRRG
jgi:hypothetical protein